MVSIVNLSVAYANARQRTQALANCSFEVSKGEICAIVGPSGCGKSTLLHVLAGVLSNYTGEVKINNRQPRDKGNNIGVVPQKFGLLPWKRVKENILFPHTLKKTTPSPALFKEFIETLGLEDLLDRFPNQLSGGQQQRVALARAFIQNPDVLLMDEPFSALDAFTAAKSRELFKKVWQKHQVTTLLITHNLEEALSLSTHVILFTPAPGQVLASLKNPSKEEVYTIIEKAWL